MYFTSTWQNEKNSIKSRVEKLKIPIRFKRDKEGGLTIVPAPHHAVVEGGVAPPVDGVVRRQLAGPLGIVEEDGLAQCVCVVLGRRTST